MLCVKESIQAYEIKLEREADCNEVWCKIVSGNSILPGLVRWISLTKSKHKRRG